MAGASGSEREAELLLIEARTPARARARACLPRASAPQPFTHRGAQSLRAQARARVCMRAGVRRRACSSRSHGSRRRSFSSWSSRTSPTRTSGSSWAATAGRGVHALSRRPEARACAHGSAHTHTRAHAHAHVRKVPFEQSQAQGVCRGAQGGTRAIAASSRGQCLRPRVCAASWLSGGATLCKILHWTPCRMFHEEPCRGFPWFLRTEAECGPAAGRLKRKEARAAAMSESPAEAAG